MTCWRQSSRSSARRSMPSASTRPARRVVQAAQQLGQRRLAGAVLADDGERAPGRDRQVEAVEHQRAARVAERDVAEAQLGTAAGRRASPCRRSAQRAGRRHRPLERADGGDRRGGAVEGPVEAAEGDGADADRPPAGRRSPPASVRSPSAARTPSDQNATTLAASTMARAPSDRPLAQPGRLVLQVVEVPALAGEAVDDPVGEPEQAHLLGGRRVDGEAVRVVGVALGAHHLRRAALEPDRALAQHPVGRRPGQHEHDRLPPAVPGEHDGRGDAGDEPDEAVGDEVHAVRQRRAGDAEVEVAGHRQVVGQVGALEVGDARGVERGRHQAVVERRRRAVAEVGAERLVERADDLAGDEHDGHRRRAARSARRRR